MKEKEDLTRQIYQNTVTTDKLNQIEAFCAKIREGLDQSDFEAKRRIIELLDVKCKIDVINDEKAIWLKCLIEPNEQPLVLPVPTSRLSNNHSGNTIMLTTWVFLDQWHDNRDYDSLTAMLFSRTTITA